MVRESIKEADSSASFSDIQGRIPVGRKNRDFDISYNIIGVNPVSDQHNIDLMIVGIVISYKNFNEPLADNIPVITFQTLRGKIRNNYNLNGTVENVFWRQMECGDLTTETKREDKFFQIDIPIWIENED